jgi:hypothetical protein
VVGGKMLKIVETRGVRDEYYGTYEIEAIRDGKKVLRFHAGPLSECPEDAILERDLSYAYMAVEFFKLGMEAAKSGEEVVFEEREEEE